MSQCKPLTINKAILEWESCFKVIIDFNYKFVLFIYPRIYLDNTFKTDFSFTCIARPCGTVFKDKLI